MRKDTHNLLNRRIRSRTYGGVRGWGSKIPSYSIELIVIFDVNSIVN